MRMRSSLKSSKVVTMTEMEECGDLQIDLGYSSREPAAAADYSSREPATTAGGGGGVAVEGQQAGMTWLEAAEHVLRENGGPGMHIRDLTRVIVDLGIAKSSCSTSLETLLYRQTSKPASKFIRVPGKMGWFGLRRKTGEELERERNQPPPTARGSRTSTTSVTAAAATQVSGASRPVVEKEAVEGDRGVGCDGGVGGDGGDGREEREEDWKFNPKVVYKKKKSRDGGASVCSGSASDDSEWSSSSDEETEALYHKRYIFTKRMAKGIIYENVAMAEQLKLIEQKITTAEAERKFLLEKFVKFSQRSKLMAVPLAKTKRPTVSSAASSTSSAKTVVKASSSTSAVSAPNPHSLRGPPPLISLSQVASTVAQQVGGAASGASCLSALLAVGESGVTGAGGQGKKASVAPRGETGPARGGQRSPKPQALVASEHSSSMSSSSSSSGGSDTEAGAGGGTGSVLGAEPTDSRAKGSKRKVGKTRRLHPIPLNDDGSPLLPIQIGGLKVYSLGKIVYDRAAYHNERYLLPIGFHSSRAYPSMISPNQRTTYHCTILDGGDAPLFEMRAEDSGESVRASSSTACQSIVLRAINKARDRQATNSGSGPEFFGYSHPTILNLLQKLPNAGRCSKYKFIKFESPAKPAVTETKTKGKRKNVVGNASKQQQKGEGSDRPQTKKMRLSASPKPVQAVGTVLVVSGGLKQTPGGGGAGGGAGVGATTDPSLAPVLGSGMSKLGMETGVGLYSSSEDWSSSDSERELTVDL